MPHWKSINVTYLYDGTFNGLLTIVFDCYIAHTLPTKIISEEQYEPNLLDHLNRIQTDQQKAAKDLPMNSKKYFISYFISLLLCFFI